jgi:hypothetical protein
MIRLPLASQNGDIAVELRLSRLRGCWIASADTPDGPTLGCSLDPFVAIYLAVDAFQPAIDDVLDALPPFATPSAG